MKTISIYKLTFKLNITRKDGQPDEDISDKPSNRSNTGEGPGAWGVLVSKATPFTEGGEETDGIFPNNTHDEVWLSGDNKSFCTGDVPIDKRSIKRSVVPVETAPTQNGQT